jgi:hypothetical protein
VDLAVVLATLPAQECARHCRQQQPRPQRPRSSLQTPAPIAPLRIKHLRAQIRHIRGKATAS